MRYRILIVMVYCLGCGVYAQEKANPIVENFGGIYEIPKATVKTDPILNYEIVIDVVTASEDKSETAWGLINVARLLNLHAVSGADMSKMKVVLAIHGPVTFALLHNEAYQKRFKMDNPNLHLIKELKTVGVKLTVCGQSMVGRGVITDDLSKEIEVATSMLTTVTTYQLKGYALLKF